MATEREIKIDREDRLFDILSAITADNEQERMWILMNLFERAQSGMTAEEIDAVRERVARSNKFKKGIAT